MHFNVFMFIDVGVTSSRSQDTCISRAAAPGQTVLLPCKLIHTKNQDWQYQRDTDRHRSHHEYMYNITHNGVISSKFADRFQLHAEGLLIKDVQENDQGTYTCVDQHDHRRQRRICLFVPCKSTSYSVSVGILVSGVAMVVGGVNSPVVRLRISKNNISSATTRRLQ